MSIIHPDYLFLNTDLVDETWTLFKKDGLTSEKVKEIAGKASLTAKFGMGKIWKWLTTDLEFEASGEVEKKTSTTYTYTAFLRALLLSELIPQIHQDITKKENLKSFFSGTYLTYTCSDLWILPIPTYANFLRTGIIANMIQEKNETGWEDKREEMLALIENMATSQKSISLGALLYDEEGNETIYSAIWNGLAEGIICASIVSNNDLLLIVGRPAQGERDMLVATFVEEKFFKPQLAAYAINRPVKIFGRKTHLKEVENIGHIVGLNTLSVCLE